MRTCVCEYVCGLIKETSYKGSILMVSGFNDTSTLVGHYMPSPREREKREERDRKERRK